MLPETVRLSNRNVQDALVAALVLVVGFGGFALGRYSKETAPQTHLQIREVAMPAAAGSSAIAGGVVASKTSSKYHLPWCAGAQTIREENKVWFASAAEARAAGYTPAANCKGIE